MLGDDTVQSGRQMPERPLHSARTIGLPLNVV
jgi:hypothetical protein